MEPDTKETFTVTNSDFEHYGAYLKENSRPPSRDGNTRANHQHVITINGEKYSWLGFGSKKWAYKGDLVSFEWEWDKTRKYRNVISETFRAIKDGRPIVRGIRGTKKWRTAPTRLPASRREQRD